MDIESQKYPLLHLEMIMTFLPSLNMLYQCNRISNSEPPEINEPHCSPKFNPVLGHNAIIFKCSVDFIF